MCVCLCVLYPVCVCVCVLYFECACVCILLCVCSHSVILKQGQQVVVVVARVVRGAQIGQQLIWVGQIWKQLYTQIQSGSSLIVPTRIELLTSLTVPTKKSCRVCSNLGKIASGQTALAVSNSRSNELFPQFIYIILYIGQEIKRHNNGVNAN